MISAFELVYVPFLVMLNLHVVVCEILSLILLLLQPNTLLLLVLDVVFGLLLPELVEIKVLVHVTGNAAAAVMMSRGLVDLGPESDGGLELVVKGVVDPLSQRRGIPRAVVTRLHLRRGWRHVSIGLVLLHDVCVAASLFVSLMRVLLDGLVGAEAVEHGQQDHHRKDKQHRNDDKDRFAGFHW